ncbi:MAG TPA: sigma-70 family RNA polymerase sigma factor [Vicinamibacterales bacterium]|nr:sigma-70 family RNA polymerase sigma factor [Vicinamibacterales bacterium]
MAESDAPAIARARAGDADAFRELVDRHSRAVFRVAYRITGRAEDAEDVVQETFLRAYRQLDRFESRANFGTWLHRIASNCAVDLLRARPAREMAEEPETLERLGGTGTTGASPSPERSVLGGQIRERVSAALAGLTEMERAAFTLRHFEGLSIEEISRTLGLRASATKHSIFRAVRKMRRELQPFIA